uniref:Uncharacterized protein n=2 Tax=Lotharella globosa TaxID=91324 RepID=A0A7S3YYU4_9EUKA|mmetsp:Transcript_8089/g.15239  ORF Transcript_8089/g.15239 Transcript_8089/m.15239 type:complete len:144 (+) Transcript_8089:49-480(+)
MPVVEEKVDDETGEFSACVARLGTPVVTFSPLLFTAENEGWRYQIRGGILATDPAQGWQEFACHPLDTQDDGQWVKFWLHSSLEDFRPALVGERPPDLEDRTFCMRKLFYKCTELQLHEETMRRFHRRVRDLARSGDLSKLSS